MMKDRMNSPSFMIVVLSALFCLWITPGFGQTIVQAPNPGVFGKALNLTVTGINVTIIGRCDWFKGSDVVESALISWFDRNANQTKDTQSGITINNECTLTFSSLAESDKARYTLMMQTPDLKMINIVLNGVERFEMSCMVLLAVAGLVSSLTIF